LYSRSVCYVENNVSGNLLPPSSLSIPGEEDIERCGRRLESKFGGGGDTKRETKRRKEIMTKWRG
jgi:hypothetical protein